jgi:hypothetical protein
MKNDNSSLGHDLKPLAVITGIAFLIVAMMMPHMILAMGVGAIGALISMSIWLRDDMRILPPEIFMRLPREQRAAELQRMKDATRLLETFNRRMRPVVVTLSIAIVLKAVYDFIRNQ